MLSVILPFTVHATEGEELACAEVYQEYLDQSGKQLIDFMDTHFKHPASTTKLVPAAMEKYNTYKKMISLKLQLLKAKAKEQGEKDQLELFRELEKCDKAMKDHIFAMDVVVNDHVRRNTTVKRSFIIIDQYKNINDKMNKLNRAIAQMKGYFDVFDSKMPGFVPMCVKQ